MLVEFLMARLLPVFGELLLDGDLLFLIERMLHIRGLSTVRISKAKGHADEALVRAAYCSWFR